MSVLLLMLGLAVALGSQPIVKSFVHWVREQSGVPVHREGKGVPPWIVGTFERILAFFWNRASHDRANRLDGRETCSQLAAADSKGRR